MASGDRSFLPSTLLISGTSLLRITPLPFYLESTLPFRPGPDPARPRLPSFSGSYEVSFQTTAIFFQSAQHIFPFFWLRSMSEFRPKSPPQTCSTALVFLNVGHERGTSFPFLLIYILCRPWRTPSNGSVANFVRSRLGFRLLY